jgi:hypothetical protein
LNIKLGLITALFAFLISFVLGLLSGTTLVYIIIRALIFGAVFFGLGIGLGYVKSAFFYLPEEENHSVDITVGDSVHTNLFGSEFKIPENELPSEPQQQESDVEPILSFKIDNIDALFSNKKDAGPPKPESKASVTENASPSRVVEQSSNYEYNHAGDVATSEDESELQDVKAASPEKKARSFTESKEFVPGMPALDSFNGKTSDSGDMEDASFFAKSGGEKKATVGTVEMSVGNRPKKEDGFKRFDGKKMAGAIQTILKKE